MRSFIFRDAVASPDVQIWTLPHILTANLDLEQRGRYPTSGRVLAGLPVATISTQALSSWDELVLRIQEAASLSDDFDGYALLDIWGRFAQLGPEACQERQRCMPMRCKTQTIRWKDAHSPLGVAGNTFGVRIAKRLADRSAALSSSVEITTYDGVSQLLIAPKTARTCGGDIFVWVKAFVPNLQLIGGFFISPQESLHVAGVSGLNQMETVTSIGAWGLLGQELQWWREEDSCRTLEPLDATQLAGSSGLRSGHILLAHKGSSSLSCEELYAQVREARQPVLVSNLPTWSFSMRRGDAETCQICLQSFSIGDSMKALPCLHSFHCHCLDTWLNQSSACPICRNEVRFY